MAVGGVNNNLFNAARSIDHSAQSVDLESISKQPEYISFQLENVLKDGKISVAELEQYPELVNHIEVTLGYGSVTDFVQVYAVTGNDTIFDANGTLLENKEIMLPEAAVEAIRASISGSVGPAVDVYSADGTGDLPTNIDTASTFVVFKLPGGQKITFDGPEAGKLAFEFATIYNNSETFKTTITDLADANGDRYAFHSASFETETITVLQFHNGSGGVINSENYDYPQGIKILGLVSVHQSPSSSDQQATFYTVLEELADNGIQF